jgi:hypothetical protein
MILRREVVIVGEVLLHFKDGALFEKLNDIALFDI